jgi:site-specific DNA recombinase
MISAIYARKSTEQTGVNEEEKSVTRQIEHAKAYAKKKGWAVSEEHIYSDDGISGAEFGERRPSFFRLMNALKPKPPFQVLIMSEESRLGREQIQTAYALQKITEAGVRVFLYLTDAERKLETAADKLMLSILNFGPEFEREKASQRTHDKMLQMANALHVTGCRVFGYDNVDVPGPDGTRSHVVRRINEAEATIVRQIFTRYAQGIGGLKTLAKELNAQGVLPPHGHRRGWDGSCIREILYRPLYRGTVVWNKTQAIHKDGTQKSRRRPEADWVTKDAPDLRIVPEALSRAVDKRLSDTRIQYARVTRNGRGGKFVGHPSGADLRSAYLLSGLAQCAWCEGSLVGLKRGKGHGKNCYLCVRHHHRGPEICANDIRINEGVLNDAVLEAVRRVIEPRMIQDAVTQALETLRARRTLLPDQRRLIERDRAVCDTRIRHLVEAVATGKGGEAVFVELQKAQAHRTTLTAQLDQADHLARVSSLDLKRIERHLTDRANDLLGLLGQHIPQTRQVLRKLIPDQLIEGKRVPGRIICTPFDDAREQGYTFLARGSYSRLLGTGLAINDGGGGQGS